MPEDLCGDGKYQITKRTKLKHETDYNSRTKKRESKYHSIGCVDVFKEGDRVEEECNSLASKSSLTSSLVLKMKQKYCQAKPVTGEPPEVREPEKLEDAWKQWV